MQIDPVISLRFRQAAAVAAGLTLAMAVAIGIAWATGAGEVSDAFSGEARMRFNAALVLALVAAGLLVSLAGVPKVGRLLGGAGAILAGLTLLQYVFDADFGIDELFVSDTLTDPADDPGRMAPNSAVALTLIGGATAAWGLGAAPRVDPAKIAAAAGALVGLLGLTGYATGTTDLFGVGEVSSMAATTAAGSVALGFAHLFSMPDRGLTAILAERGEGGNLARALLPAIIGAPLLLGWVIFEGSDAGLYDVRASAWILLIALITSLTIATLLMARSLGTVEDKRRESEQRGLEFFRLSRDMLATINRDGYLVDLNEAWTDSLGYAPEELSSRPFLDFVHDDDRERAAESAAELFSGAGSITFENRWRTKDGGWRRLLWSAVVSPASDLIVARITDITELKRQEAELIRTVDELARSNADLEQFASVASHDLSEPLRTIKGFSQLLERRYVDEVDERGRHYLLMIGQGTDRLQELIDDLLIYSRAGKRSIEISEFNMNELVDEVVAALATRMEETSATVSVDELPRVAADRTKLAQLLQNLISNALTYNDTRPSIRIQCRRTGGDWQFSVEDNGIGIPPHQRERVFEPFRRLHTRAEYSGSGIGLSVCRRIVERHGGTIWAEEAADGGTRIMFTVPTNLSPGTAVVGAADNSQTVPAGGAARPRTFA